MTTDDETVTPTAFYSAMPVALVGAMAGVLASIGTLMATGHQIRLLLIAGVARSIIIADDSPNGRRSGPSPVSREP